MGRHADFRQDPHGQDDHPGRRAVGHDREREGEDPGQGGHPAGPAAPHLRGRMKVRSKKDAYAVSVFDEEEESKMAKLRFQKVRARQAEKRRMLTEKAKRGKKQAKERRRAA